MYDETSWYLAAQETVMTWALFGATIISVFSAPQNSHGTNLKRDIMIVVCLTICGLILSALLANACINVLRSDVYYVDKRNSGKGSITVDRYNSHCNTVLCFCRFFTETTYNWIISGHNEPAYEATTYIGFLELLEFQHFCLAGHNPTVCHVDAGNYHSRIQEHECVHKLCIGCRPDVANGDALRHSYSTFFGDLHWWLMVGAVDLFVQNSCTFSAQRPSV